MGLLTDWLCDFFNMYVGTTSMLDDWKHAIIISLQKEKHSKSECGGEQFIKTTYKILGKILIKRIWEITIGNIWNVHCSFSQAKDVLQKDFTLQKVTEICMIARKESLLCA